MFITRSMAAALQRFAKFPVVGVFGPRQSGKTTLVRHFFNKHTYLNLEDHDLRDQARKDPKGLLANYASEHGIILDEFQYAPEILSYLQLEADAQKRPGYFVITGSQNFLMNEAVTQSLAGRIGILTLLPLSLHELRSNNQLPAKFDEALFLGGYPRILTDNITPREFYPSYVNSYLERDIRQLVNVDNLIPFQQFMQLCAGRMGQPLNIADIATNCGVEQKTIRRWLSILEACYIIFFVGQYKNNFNRRVTARPKMYFYDTGLVCSLLDIKTPHEITNSVFRGFLFENLIIADLHKQYLNRGERPPLYFWRDKNGTLEVDCLVKLGNKLVAIEIKSGMTVNQGMFDGLLRWSDIAEVPADDRYVVYGGELEQQRSMAHLVGWQQVGDLVEKIELKR